MIGAKRKPESVEATSLLIIDEAELDAVRSHLPRDCFSALLDKCLEQISKHIDELAMSNVDLPRLAALAHSMVGSAGVIGARKVEALARQLEAACAAGRSSAVDALRTRLSAAWAEAAHELACRREATRTH